MLRNPRDLICRLMEFPPPTNTNNQNTRPALLPPLPPSRFFAFKVVAVGKAKRRAYFSLSSQVKEGAVIIIKREKSSWVWVESRKQSWTTRSSTRKPLYRLLYMTLSPTQRFKATNPGVPELSCARILWLISLVEISPTSLLLSFIRRFWTCIRTSSRRHMGN